MGALLGPDFPTRIALAVSGGGDSMAMLALAHGWARVMGVGLAVVTVDHGLRDGSAAEAAMVARECAALGHAHATLRWHWDGTGNLQDAARDARLRLIDGWRGDIAHVLFAHTRDDQAETVLLRLARGSGVDGLSAMSDRRRVTPATPARGFWQIRPLLEEARADLRHHADTLRLPYVDDPSNDDPRFQRVRARQALAVLADLGVTPEALSDTARRLTRARDALVARAVSVLPDLLRSGAGDGGRSLYYLVTATTAGRAGNRATRSMRRSAQLQLHCMGRIGSDPTISTARGPPRWRRLARPGAWAGRTGRRHAPTRKTLQGVALTACRRRTERSASFGSNQAVPTDRDDGRRCHVWDGMWEVAGPAVDGFDVRALGPDRDRRRSRKRGACKAVPFDAALVAACDVFDRAPGLVRCAARPWPRAAA